MNLKHLDSCGPARCTVPYPRGDGSYLWICAQCSAVGIEFDQKPRNRIEAWALKVRSAFKTIIHHNQPARH